MPTAELVLISQIEPNFIPTPRHNEEPLPGGAGQGGRRRGAITAVGTPSDGGDGPKEPTLDVPAGDLTPEDRALYFARVWTSRPTLDSTSPGAAFRASLLPYFEGSQLVDQGNEFLQRAAVAAFIRHRTPDSLLPLHLLGIDTITVGDETRLLQPEHMFTPGLHNKAIEQRLIAVCSTWMHEESNWFSNALEENNVLDSWVMALADKPEPPVEFPRNVREIFALAANENTMLVMKILHGQKLGARIPFSSLRGEINANLGSVAPTSELTHHLISLQEAEVIEMSKEGYVLTNFGRKIYSLLVSTAGEIDSMQA